jgi:tRNA(Ile)-lysidine synthetase-like protein
MTPDPRCLFRDAVLATIEARALLPRRTTRSQPAEPVVVGVSGGPDSIALLAALSDLAGLEAPGTAGGSAGHMRPSSALAIAPIVAHLNHGLRGRAADEDQQFVEDLARARGLPCEVGHADVRADATALGLGIEEAARLARRRFLADIARRRGATKVALAHHADDRAETILFHILRGTGVEGLASLGARAPLSPADGIEIIRPLIAVTHDFALGYLQTLGQAFREDESNSERDFTRNRLRHDLLPHLRHEFNPKVEEALIRLGDQAAAASEVLADALDATWRQVVREVPAAPGAATSEGAIASCEATPAVCDGNPLLLQRARTAPGATGGLPASAPAAILIDADDFAPLRPWLQGAILRRAVDRLGGGLKFMSAERTREVLAQLLAKTVAGPVDLPDGLVAERNRRTIRLERRTEK